MDRDGGLRYCAGYMVRYILASMAVAAFLAYIALSISGILWDDPWSALFSLIDGVAGSMSVKWALAGVPLIVMAFLVGANEKGTLARLSSRIVLNICLAVLMVWVSSSPEYIFDTTVINDSVTMMGMTIGMDAMPITLFLLVIPVSSLTDAFLEYRGGDVRSKSPYIPDRRRMCDMYDITEERTRRLPARKMVFRHWNLLLTVSDISGIT